MSKNVNYQWLFSQSPFRFYISALVFIEMISELPARAKPLNKAALST